MKKVTEKLPKRTQQPGQLQPGVRVSDEVVAHILKGVLEIMKESLEHPIDLSKIGKSQTEHGSAPDKTRLRPRSNRVGLVPVSKRR